MEASGHDLLALAEALARVKHAEQRRKGTGEPYFNHLLRVEGRVVGWRAKTIAFLHDLIEDTSLTPLDLRHIGFPWDVIDDVVALSRDTDEDYFVFIERGIRDGSMDALYVKLADLTDNLHDDWTASNTTLRARYIKADLMVRAAIHRNGGILPVTAAS